MKRNFFLWLLVALIVTAQGALNLVQAQSGYRNSAGNVLPFSTTPSTNDVINIGTTGSPISPTNKNVRLARLFGGTSQTWQVGNATTFATTVGDVAKLYFAEDHGNGHGYVALGGLSGDVVLSPTLNNGILQLGATANAGNRIYLQYASIPTVGNGYTYGFSHPLMFVSRSRNQWHYPGILSFAQPDDSEHGEIWVYSRAPEWNSGNADPASPNVAGTPVVSMGTNGVIAQGNTWFRGRLGSPGDVWATNDVRALNAVGAGSRVEVGSGASGSGVTYGVDISSGANNGLLVGAEVSTTARANAANKYFYFTAYPRNNAEPKCTVMNLWMESSGMTINIGGGTGVNQPAAVTSIYAGAAGSASAGNEQVNVSNGRTEVKSGKFIISAASVPASASASGEAGQIAWDSGYIYVCTAANTWKRVAIATW